MKIKGYEKIGEQLYSEKLENGLTVYVMPKKGFNKSYAFFATDYGGADRRFFLSGKWLDTPAGVAHFLEHKMFDTPDGNALTRLSANGASPNAYTSTDITAYHFESIEKFEENLEILLDFVSVPYFTEESVRKEQGIIGQEIRMTEDDPNFVVYYGLMKALFAHHPLRDSVAGTIESIAEITAETLYNCHKVFYNPSNMVLCVAGDVDPEKIVEVARRVLPKEPGEIPLRDYGPEESLLPVTAYSERKMEVGLPLFLGGCKIAAVKGGEEYLRQELLADMAIQILMGRSSPLYVRLYAEGLINNNFEAAYEAAAGAAFLLFGGESKDPKKVHDAVLDEIDAAAKSGVDRTLFETTKKTLYGQLIRSLNSFSSLCHGRATAHFRGFDSLRAPEILMDFTAEDVDAFIREHLKRERFALSTVFPVSGSK
ncbi:MAG: insulinase family protein [Clostridiales bacterium]|nr:insulinase family protein [Clostridiales bacterium]